MSHSYIMFTGDYSKLKNLGFAFQRLYASNYMQWCNDKTRVWKRGAEVTHDELTNYEGPFFELYLKYKNANQELPFDDRHDWLRVVTNRAERTVSFDYKTYVRQSRQLHDDPLGPYNLECRVLMREDLAMLDKFYELGWVELGTSR